jgi:hypothetical protein
MTQPATTPGTSTNIPPPNRGTQTRLFHTLLQGVLLTHAFTQPQNALATPLATPLATQKAGCTRSDTSMPHSCASATLCDQAGACSYAANLHLLVDLAVPPPPGGWLQATPTALETSSCAAMRQACNHTAPTLSAAELSHSNYSSPPPPTSLDSQPWHGSRPRSCVPDTLISTNDHRHPAVCLTHSSQPMTIDTQLCA